MRYDTLKGLFFVIVSEKKFNLDVDKITRAKLCTTMKPDSRLNYYYVTEELFRKKYLCDDFLLKWDRDNGSFGVLKQDLISGLSRGDSFYCSLDLEMAKQFVLSRKLPQKNYILIGVDLPEDSGLDCEFNSSNLDKIKLFMSRQV